MLDQAIEKIRDEMAKAPNNTYVQVVGDFLLRHVTAHPDDAAKVLAEGKTIAKSLDGMSKEASKQKSGNVAVLTDAQGFGIVLKYFGIKGKASARATPAPQAVTEFNVSLDDFL